MCDKIWDDLNKELGRNPTDEEQEAAWKEVKEKITQVDPVLGSVMVPECIYRGFCPEFHSCGYVDTEAYPEALAAYRTKG